MALAAESGEVTVIVIEEVQYENRRLQNILQRLRRLEHQSTQQYGHPRAFVKLLGELCDGLGLRFALEEADGYFADAVDVAPQIADRVEALRCEHAQLFDVIRDLVDEAEDAWTRHELSYRQSQFAQRFHDFDEQLQRHEALENALILAAFDEDIGVGD